MVWRTFWQVLTLLILPISCIFAGDKCLDDNRVGICQRLSSCRPLLEEIRNAGTPMPSYMRARLQLLACGFEDDQPLVCCSSSAATNENPLTNRPPFSQGWATDNSNTPSENPGWDIDNNGPENNNQNPSDENKRGNTDHSATGPPDISRHRNLRLLPTVCGLLESDRIIGGNRTMLYEYPWMVLIAYDSRHGTKLSCGGTLITERYVLTAAHCVSFLGNSLTLTGVVLGEHDIRQDPDCERVEGRQHCSPRIMNVTIDTVKAHPGYSPQNLFDDIALLKLSEPADFTKVNMKPICLPINNHLQTEDLAGKKGVVAGWGATEDGLQSPVLLSVVLPIVSNEQCQTIYNRNPQIYKTQLCAGGVENRDSCGGDSGGPLMVPGVMGNNRISHVQRGIVSFGTKRCGIGSYPGVYTRVGHYMDWILDNID